MLILLVNCVARIKKRFLLQRLNFQGMRLTDTYNAMIVRIAKDSSRDQTLNVKRVGGAAGRLFDSPHPPFQSLGASQELRLASSYFLEVALD
jgi:hypothetical protein